MNFNPEHHDCIRIRDLALRCIIGLYPDERREKQDILINATLYCDLTTAGQSDDLADGVDYKAVKKALIALVEASSFQLIEALAEKIAACCLGFDKIKAVRIIIDKPGALRFARSVAVDIYRQRDQG